MFLEMTYDDKWDAVPDRSRYVRGVEEAVEHTVVASLDIALPAELGLVDLKVPSVLAVFTVRRCECRQEVQDMRTYVLRTGAKVWLPYLGCKL